MARRVGTDPDPRDPAPPDTDPPPAAAVLIVTYTVAEAEALADVLSPGPRGLLSAGNAAGVAMYFAVAADIKPSSNRWTRTGRGQTLTLDAEHRNRRRCVEMNGYYVWALIILALLIASRGILTIRDSFRRKENRANSGPRVSRNQLSTTGHRADNTAAYLGYTDTTTAAHHRHHGGAGHHNHHGGSTRAAVTLENERPAMDLLPRPGLATLVMTTPADTANGQHCATCWAIISGVEDAHRDENGDWEHDECPED